MLLLRVTSMSKGINFTPFLPAEKVLYNPKAFFIHAAWLHQACAHCAIFPTAASRRSLDRVSVPVWLVILSDQLGIVALVSRYPTNKLIPSGHIRWQEARRSPSLVLRRYAVLATVSSSYPPSIRQFPRHYSPVRHSSAKQQAVSCYRSTCMC